MAIRFRLPFGYFDRYKKDETNYSVDSCYDVQIRWSSFGIPHIKANDYPSLSFGVGYCYAKDNLELLASAILTVRGERSSEFGAMAIESVRSIANFESDLFSKFYFDPVELEDTCKRVDPLAIAMMEAYAKGIEHYVCESRYEDLPQPYRAIFKTKPIRVRDLYLLLGQKMVQTSGAAFAAAIVNAQPPDNSACASGSDSHDQTLNLKEVNSLLGSNAYALGADLTANCQGLLVGNPHFPWFGPNRFYQMHLTIPGELDVMGASLPPFPVINIGFNKDVAWSHTVSPSQRLAVYELTLVPGHPLAYRVDGRIELMRAKTVSVVVKADDGSFSEVRRTLYNTRFGPLITIPKIGCTWSKHRAYALYDAAKNDVGAIEQWLKINKATSVRDIKSVLSAHRGTLWLNTLAADRNGEVFYGDFSAVPNLSSRKLKKFAASKAAVEVGKAENIAILNGSRSQSLPKLNRRLPGRQALLPSNEMPSMVRKDYVLNSNDSHWLTNIHSKMKGYSNLIGREQVSQGFRTRMGHKEMVNLIANKGASIGPDDLKEILFSNRNYAADLVIDQLIELWKKSPTKIFVEDREIDIDQAYAVLNDWNRCDDIESRGAVLFREFWRRVQMNQQIWKTRFDPLLPLTTPCDLDIGDQDVAEFLRIALAKACCALQDLEMAIDISLGEVQRFPVKDGFIAIPGGDGSAGVLNLVEFGALGKEGYTPTAIQGTSYTQVVTWEGDRVIADAILPFSQSSNPDSLHYADQMKLFAEKGWIRLPFTEDEIQSDPNLITLRLTQSNSG